MLFKADWSDDEIESLKAHWADGLSAGQIARVMPGRSRNAIIGKVHRLGLMGRATTNNPAGPRVPKAPRIPKARRAPVTPSERQKTIAAQAAIAHPEPARLDNGKLIGTADLSEGHCRWPHGDPGAPDFHFCGQAQVKDRSYCDFHNRRQWSPSQAAAAAAERRQAEAQSGANFARMGLA